jgi:hypothetical protein
VHHRFLSATGFIANQNEYRFKPSVAKKTPIVALVPVNCMIHTTLLRKIKGAALEQEHKKCDQGEEIQIDVYMNGCFVFCFSLPSSFCSFLNVVFVKCVG